MDWQDLERGLIERGFVGTNKMHDKGECHKNEQHYILLTDGLVIYSNVWDYTKYYRYNPHTMYGDKLETIIMEEWPQNEFTFEELDTILNG